jgi:membrane protease subunit HflK
VQLLSVDPPDQVIASFRDVTAAQQDMERMRNEAEAYANRVVPEARGAAARILQEAEAYREQTVAEARGQASRFTQVYDQYRNAPEVTRERIYLETMERVLSGVNKVIIDQSAGNGVVPFLPLGQMDGQGQQQQVRPAPMPAPQQQPQQQGVRR